MPHGLCRERRFATFHGENMPKYVADLETILSAIAATGHETKNPKN